MWLRPRRVRKAPLGRQLAAAQDIPSTVYQNLVKTTVQVNVDAEKVEQKRTAAANAEAHP